MVSNVLLRNDFFLIAGQQLKALRVGRNLTQIGLAELLTEAQNSQSKSRIDQSYVSRVEKGETLSLQRWGLFCYVLDVKPWDFLRTIGEDDASPE